MRELPTSFENEQHRTCPGSESLGCLYSPQHSTSLNVWEKLLGQIPAKQDSHYVAFCCRAPFTPHAVKHYGGQGVNLSSMKYEFAVMCRVTTVYSPILLVLTKLRSHWCSCTALTENTWITTSRSVYFMSLPYQQGYKWCFWQWKQTGCWCPQSGTTQEYRGSSCYPFVPFGWSVLLNHINNMYSALRITSCIFAAAVILKNVIVRISTKVSFKRM